MHIIVANIPELLSGQELPHFLDDKLKIFPQLFSKSLDVYQISYDYIWKSYLAHLFKKAQIWDNQFRCYLNQNEICVFLWPFSG